MKESQLRQLSGVVRTLESRIELLLEDHQRLSELCRSLMRECEELKRSERNAEEQVQRLQKDLSTTELLLAMSSGSGSPQSRRAKAYVNRLMREVDNCISLLSTLGEEQGRGDEDGNEDGKEDGKE